MLDALIGVYERNVLGYPSTAVLPYSQALSRFPAHLQQLDMESNGKSVNRFGEPVNYVTNIFDYVNTRYYFNVLKISDCDLHLVDVIEDTTTLEMIRSRLNGGLRLWNGYSYQTQEESYSGELDHIGTAIFTPTYPIADYKNYKVVSVTGSVEIYNVAVNQEGKLVVYLRGNGLYTFTIKFNYLVKTITRDIGNFTYDNVEIDNL